MRPVVLAACALLLSAAEDELGYAPGGAARKAFREETSFALSSLVDLESGAELPAAEIELSGRTWRELELVDRPGAIEGGRPKDLERSFETAVKRAEIDLDLQGLEELYEIELVSALAGESVRFEWDAEEEAYAARSESGLDALHLERLSEDCDLRALLPGEAGEAAEGDAWTVDVAALAELFSPAGRVVFSADELPDGPYAALTPVDLAAVTFLTLADAARELEGQARLTWKETTGERGERAASIEIELEARLAGDASEDLARLAADLGAGGKRDVELDFEWALEGRGELLWSLAHGRFESLALELEGDLALEMTWSGADGRAGARVGFTTQSALAASAATE